MPRVITGLIVGSSTQCEQIMREPQCLPLLPGVPPFVPDRTTG
jgi:hypothetical protein